MMTNDFDSWMLQYPTARYPKGPPIKHLLTLAIQLCRDAITAVVTVIAPPPTPPTITTASSARQPANVVDYTSVDPDKILQVSSTSSSSSSSITTKKPSNRNTNDNSNGRLVTWEGIRPQWFLDVFMKLPELEAFVKFGCPMWFLRCAGILVILYGRSSASSCNSRRRGYFAMGEGGSSVVDCIEDAFPETHHSTRRVSLPGDGNQAEKQGRTKVVVSRTGKATAFVSFTGSYSIKHFARLVGSPNLKDRYLWIDTFCVNQFAWTQRKDDEMKAFKSGFMEDLRQRIAEFQCTVLFLHRWDELMATLKQIWVIWEIFSTIDGDAELMVQFTQEEQERFVREGLMKGTGGFESTRQSLATIDANQAGVFSAEDKQLILGKIKEKHGGVAQVNQRVIQRMRDWLIQTAQTALAEKVKQGDDDTLWLKSNLAVLYFECGRYSEAEPLFVATLNEGRVLYGDDHPETLDSLNNLGCVLYYQGNFEEAEPMLRTALDGRRAKLGKDHSDTLASANNLAGILSETHRAEEAETLYQEVLSYRRKNLGTSHPSTCTAMNNMGDHLVRQEKFVEARCLFQEVLDIRRKHLGNKHPDTMVSIHNMAIVHLKEENLVDAKVLFQEAFQSRREHLGTDHRDTLASTFGLASVHMKEGELVQAIPLLTKALAGYTAVLGESHPETLQVQNALLISNQILQARMMERLVEQMSSLNTGDSRPENDK